MKLLLKRTHLVRGTVKARTQDSQSNALINSRPSKMAWIVALDVLGLV